MPVNSIQVLELQAIQAIQEISNAAMRSIQEILQQNRSSLVSNNVTNQELPRVAPVSYTPKTVELPVQPETIRRFENLEVEPIQNISKPRVEPTLPKRDNDNIDPSLANLLI